MSQNKHSKITRSGKRRLLLGAIYVSLGVLAWFAQQQGWLDSDNTSNTQRPSSTQQHVPAKVSSQSNSLDNDNDFIAQLYRQRRSDEIVTAAGSVGKVLADDLKGSRHQRFLLDIGQDKWLLVAHNIDLAQKVPLQQGDAVTVHGEYEWNEKGGVLHWTHHDPRGYHEDGYIEHNGKRYK